MKLKIEPAQNSLQWIYIAKGIGIILVVIGHFHPESSPTYWSEIYRIIYSFHMPLFFILSGYLYNHTKYRYCDLIKNKTKRLLYPFVTIAAVFFLIKYAAGRVAYLAHPVDITSVYSLFVDPVKSYMPLLWFVHALFLIFAIYPVARFFLNNYMIILVLFGIISFLGSNYVVLGEVIDHMPFFVVGVILRENEFLSKIVVSTNWRSVFTPILIFMLIYGVRYSSHLYGYPFKFTLGVAGSLFVMNISQVIYATPFEKIKGLLLHVGYYSMTIYLFHTLFESTMRIVFYQGFKHIQIPFEIIAIISVWAGVFFPLELEREY